MKHHRVGKFRKPMKITIQKKEHITLTADQITKAARHKLRTMLDGDYITERDGKRWLCRWHNTGHGSGDTEFIREATELDEALVMVMEEMK